MKCSHRALDADSTDHRPKNVHTKEEPVEPGKVYEYIFELAPVDNLFKKGHQIEVEFKTMDQQFFDFNEMASLPRLYILRVVTTSMGQGSELRDPRRQ
ncbi:MAG: CocE/NonD family hydrolase C-terminal non-catalytic domain-containing protein [[Clostridium] scindens]